MKIFDPDRTLNSIEKRAKALTGVSDLVEAKMQSFDHRGECTMELDDLIPLSTFHH